MRVRYHFCSPVSLHCSKNSINSLNKTNPQKCPSYPKGRNKKKKEKNNRDDAFQNPLHLLHKQRRKTPFIPKRVAFPSRRPTSTPCARIQI